MKMTGALRGRLIVILVVVLAYLLPFVLSSAQQSLATRALIFGLIAASLDLAYGYTGLYSLGHAALAGVGGYTAGLLMVRYGIDSFWVLIASAMLASALASLVFALIALRARGLYFILVTLVLGQMLANLAQQWGFLKTAQAEAVVGIPLPSLGLGHVWTSGTFYQFILVITVIALFVLRRVIGSPVGLALRGARENEVRMEAIGYDVWRYRVLSLVISGTMCGLGGALFAFQSGLISPTNVGIAASGILVLMVIIGGSGTRYGAFVGGVIVTLLQFYASQWSPDRAPVFIGMLFILTALLNRYRPRVAAALRSLRSGRARHAAA